MIDSMAHPTDNAHEYEASIQTRLIHDPSYSFENLTVKHIPGGYCLEGQVVCSEEDFAKITEDVFSISGAQVVINRIVHRKDRLKAKG